jgi:hypothetical protein
MATALALLPGLDAARLSMSGPVGCSSELLFRLPLYLYRWGLGRLFGHRLVAVNHIGRVTGRRFRR